MNQNIEDKARLLLEGVTKGPWKANRDYVIATAVPTYECGSRGTKSSPYYEGKFLVAESLFHESDRKFIEACRELVPALCDEIDRLRKALSNAPTPRTSTGVLLGDQREYDGTE